MKKFLLLLLILNMGFFVWQFPKEKTDSRVIEPLGASDDDVVETLVLLSEAEQSKPDTIEDIPEPEQPVIVNHCFTIGPFDSDKQASHVIAQFNEADFFAESRKELKKIPGNYQVSLGEYESIQSARNELKKLRAKRVKDIAIIKLNSGMYSISLGIFSMQESTDRRVSQMTALGYSPTVERHVNIKEIYWVDFAENESMPLTDNIWSRLISDYPDISRSQVSCP